MVSQPSPSTAGCNLRFDDTNPEAEDQAYVDAIRRDIRWLGFDWGDHEHYASDYFGQLYQWAEDLVEQRSGLCRQPGFGDHSRHAGRLSTGLARTALIAREAWKKTLELLQKMRAGELPDGGGGAASQNRHAIEGSETARSAGCTAFVKSPISAPATSGPFTRCMTGPMARATLSRALTYSVCSLEFVNHLAALQLVFACARHRAPTGGRSSSEGSSSATPC